MNIDNVIEKLSELTSTDTCRVFNSWCLECPFMEDDKCVAQRLHLKVIEYKEKKEN